MIITKNMLNEKISKDMIPTRLDSAINLYSYIEDKGLVLYNVNPSSWNCLYPFYELNHKFTLDNYKIFNEDITYKELIDEYQKYYKEIHEERNGYDKQKRKQILIDEYKKTFNIKDIEINDELEPYYEIKFSKTKNVWTLYYFENYVVSKIDDVNALLHQTIYQQEYVELDSTITKVNGVDVVSSLPYVLSSEENVDILKRNSIVCKNIRIATRCYLIKDNKIVAIKYKNKGDRTGFYDLPGGKIEDGESAVECAKRECMEETGLDVKELKYSGNLIIEYPKRIFDFSVFISNSFENESVNSDENEVEFIDIEKLLNENKKFGSIKLLEYPYINDLLDCNDFKYKIHMDDDENVILLEKKEKV